MASHDPHRTSVMPNESNALVRRPLPGGQDPEEAITATNSPEAVGGVPQASSILPAAHNKHVTVHPPSEDGYEERRGPSPETRGGPNTEYWERRRLERERERERDTTWRNHPEYYQEFTPYSDRERYFGSLPPPPDGAGLRSLDSRVSRMSAPAGPPRGPPYQYGRYDDAPHSAGAPLRLYRTTGTIDEEAQYHEYMAWKHGRGRRSRRSSADLHRAKPARETSEDTEKQLRIPFLNWMGWTAKGHLVAFFGEFVGTTMFLFFAFAGTQVANVNSQADTNSTTGAATGFNAAVLLYIALVFGFSLMVNVWVFYRISGGLFNPAVTLAMLLVKSVTVFRASLLFIAQILGSIFASYLVKTIFPTNFNVRTTLSADTSLTRGVFIEGILTAELIFAIFMLAKEKHKATFIAPVGIGLALFIAELVGVYYTGGSLNPARSFGPCVVTKTFDREHWIYWVGPTGGAIVATVLYKFILVMQYELANPGQDEESKEAANEKAEEAKVKAEHLDEEEKELERQENDINRL